MISAIALSITAGVVFAASVHFKNSTPVTTTRSVDKLTLSVSGALTGLGNGDVTVTVVANANPTATCSNPGSGNKAPGQNPAQVTVTGQVNIPANSIKNGNVAFTVTTVAPGQPTSAAAGCPNGSWTARIDCMAFTGYTITVEQPTGSGILVLGPTAFSVSGAASSCA